MSYPLITAVIPTYHRPGLLQRAIASVLAQSFGNLRVCVYDNASADETEEVVSKIMRQDDRVVYTKNKRNLGPIRNMIQGIEAVSTDFYSLLSDDDFLMPDFYAHAMREIAKFPEAGFVCSKTITVDVAANKMRLKNADWPGGRYEPGEAAVAKMFKSHFSQTGVLFRSGMRQLIGSCERSGNDILYMSMAAACSPFIVLDTFGAAFMVHPTSYSAVWRSKEDVVLGLYDAYLGAVGDVMRMDIAAQLKVYILTLATMSISRNSRAGGSTV